jgi:LysR family nitrogen assimilation transcriptional regulator
LRETIERHANVQGVKLKIHVEMDSLSHIKTLVARGSGYSILAPAAVIEEMRNGSLILAPIREPVIQRTVYLVRNPARPVTQATLIVEGVTADIVCELLRNGGWRGRMLRSSHWDGMPAQQHPKPDAARLDYPRVQQNAAMEVCGPLDQLSENIS